MTTTRYVVQAIPADLRTFFPHLREGDVIEVTDRGFPTEADQKDAPRVTLVQTLHPNTAWFLGELRDRVLRPEQEQS